MHVSCSLFILVFRTPSLHLGMLLFVRLFPPSPCKPEDFFSVSVYSEKISPNLCVTNWFYVVCTATVRVAEDEDRWGGVRLLFSLCASCGREEAFP